MRIFHDAHASCLAHEGETYEADDEGHIEVPEEVGRAVIRFPGWHQYTGEPELSDEEIEDSLTKKALQDRIEELEAEVNRLKAPKKAPAAKKAAPTQD